MADTGGCIQEDPQSIYKVNKDNLYHPRAEDQTVEISYYDCFLDCGQKKGPMICRFSVSVSRKTSLFDLVRELGFTFMPAIDYPGFCTGACATLPYYDDGEEFVWGPTLADTPVLVFLDYYKLDRIVIFTDEKYAPQWGADTGFISLFQTLMDALNLLFKEYPFYAQIASAIVTIIISKSYEAIKQSINKRQEADPFMTAESLRKCITSRDEWDALELMHKMKFKDMESLEFLMCAFGYILHDGKFINEINKHDRTVVDDKHK